MPQISRKMTIQLLKSADERLRTLQAQGIKLVSANRLLIKAKKALKANNVNETVSLMNELGAKLEEIKKYSTDFINQILSCDKLLKFAETIGVDVTKLRARLEEAHETFDSEDFPGAIEIAQKCNQDLIDKLFLSISDTLKQEYDKVMDLPKNIIDSHQIQQMLNDADSAIKNNDFSLAWTITQQLKEITDKIAKPYLEKVREHAMDKIIEFQNEIENARNKRADLSDAQEIFTDLKNKMPKAKLISDFKEIIDYTAAGNHALERSLRRQERIEIRSREALDKFDLMKHDLEDLKTHIAIPSSVEAQIQQAKEALTKGNFETVVEYMTKCETKLNKLRHGSEPKIELVFQNGQLRSDLWNRTNLTITNKGLASANNIKISFSGPVEVRRITVLNVLEYNKTRTIEIGLKPEGAGSLPVDVDIDFSRSWDGMAYHEHQEIWVDVIPTVQPTSTIGVSPGLKKSHPYAAPATAQVEKNDEDFVECLYCQKQIEDSAPIFKCTCDTIYHLECINGLEICLKCGIDIRHQVGVVNAPKHQAHQYDTEDADWE